MGTFRAGSILTILELNSERFVAGIRKADKKTQDFRESLDRLSQGFSGIAVRSAAAFAALATGIGIATKIGAEFQDEIVNVGAVTGAAGDALQELEDIAIKAGESTKFSATEAAAAMFNLGSQGLKTADEFKSVLKPALDLAAASQADVGLATEALLASLAGFGLKTSQATEVADLFSAANENSQLNLFNLSRALPLVAATADGLGVSLKDTTAILSGLAEAGIKGQRAGTGLKVALGLLAKASGPAAKELEKLGFRQNRINKLLPTPIKLFSELSKAGLTAAQALQIFGLEGGPAVLAITKQLPKINALRDALDKGAGSAARVAAIQLTSFGNQMKLLGSKVQTLAIQIFKSLEPALRDIRDRVEAVVISMVNFVKNNRGLVKAVLLGATAFTGILAAVTGFLAILFSGVAAVVSFKVSIIGLTAAFPALAKVITLANVKMLAFGAGMIGIAAVAGFQFGKLLDKFIRDKFPLFSDGLDQIVKKLINFETAMRRAATATERTFALGLEKAAKRIDGVNLSARFGLRSIKNAAKDAGLEFDQLSPSLKKALQGVEDGTEAAKLFRAEAERINKSLALQAKLQEKAAEAARAGRIDEPGAEFGEVTGGGAADPENAKRRVAALKFLEGIKEELATKDMTRDQITLTRLQEFTDKRILSEQEVADIKLALQAQVAEEEQKLQTQKELAFAQQLDNQLQLTAASANFIEDVVTGQETIGEAAKNLGKTILQTLVKSLAQAVAKAIILDGILKKIAKGQGAGGGAAKKVGGLLGLLGPVGSIIGSILPFQAGGEIPSGEDGFIAAEAGEFMLSRKSVRALGGAGALDSLQEVLAGGSPGAGGMQVTVIGKVESLTGDVSQDQVERFVEKVVDRINFRFGSIGI